MDLEAFAATPRSQASTTGSSCGMQPRDGQTGAVDRTAPEKHRRVSSGDGWMGGECGDSGRSEAGKDAGWGDGLSHIDGQTNQPTMVDVQVRENLNADRCLFARDVFLCLSSGDHRASRCPVMLRLNVAFHGLR